MKKEEASGNGSSITDLLRSYIKVFSISELKARFLGVRVESWSVLVFENGAVRETTI